MSLMHLAQEYDQLGPGEQSLFAEVIKRLLTEGLLWRDDEADRKAYNFLGRRSELVSEYLKIGGWQLVFHESARIYHVTHVDGAHRRRLSRELTIWLLIVRLLYAEKRERVEVTLTRQPVVKVGDIADRYASYFPNQRVRKKSSLTEALRAMQGMKLITAAGSAAVLRADDPDRLVELRPALEVILPADEITALTQRLSEYQRAGADSDPDAASSGMEDTANA